MIKMNQSPSTTNFIRFGSLILIAAGGTWLILAQLNIINTKSLNPEQVIQILKEMKRNYYPILSKVALKSKEAKMQFNAQGNTQPTQDQLKTNILETCPIIGIQIENNKNQALKKYKATEEQLVLGIEKHEQKYKEIKELKKEIDQNFFSSLEGNLPKISSAADLSQYSKSQTLLFIEGYAKWMAEEIIAFSIEKLEEGSYASMLMMDVMKHIQSINIFQEKSKILEQHGFGGKDEHPLQIYDAVLEKFVLDKNFEILKKEIDAVVDKVFSVIYDSVASRESLEELRVEARDFDISKNSLWNNI